MLDLDECKPWLEQEVKGDANLPYLSTLGPSGNADGQIEGATKGDSKRKKRKDNMVPKPLKSLVVGEPNS